MNLSGQFLRFGIVGTAGYLVDISVLYLMHYLGMDLYSGRIISFIVAATTTWIGNRLFTFNSGKSSPKKLTSEWASYISAMSLGGIANYATYAMLITYLTIFREHLWLAVAAATGVGMMINFVLARRILYSSDA